MNANSDGKILHAAGIFSLLRVFTGLGDIKLGISPVNWFQDYGQMLIVAFSGEVRGSTRDVLNTMCVYSFLTVKYT